MSRAPKQPVAYQDNLKIPEKFLRFSTPEVVANYRAERLKCDVLVEIGSGIGGQTIAFAKKCSKVICVELDEEKMKVARKNLADLGIKNVFFLRGNALDEKIISQIKKENPDIIFCDTERAEKGERTIFGLNPDIQKLLKKYSEICENIAVEIPPFTSDLEKLETDFESEFISLNGKLNRLTLYLNSLKKTEKSVVLLPEKIILAKKEKTKNPEKVESCKGFEFLSMINPTVVLAELVPELSEGLAVKLITFGKKYFFVSKEKIDSPFLENYQILDICGNKFEEILDSAKKVSALKVVPRYEIEPKDYWKIRNKYENSLKENKNGIEVQLFIFSDEAVICKKLPQ